MKILVIGGTSFYGKLLVEKLLAKGHEVTIFSRGNIITPILQEKGVKHIKGDRTHYSTFPDHFKDCSFDVVYDNMAMDEKDVSVTVETFSGKIKHYIFCSSVAVYANWNRAKPYREDEIDYKHEAETNLEFTQTHNWLIGYGNGKRRAENVLVNTEQKFPYTIIRPAVIQGENDPVERTNYWVQRILNGYPLIVPGESQYTTLLQHIYSDDLAELAIDIIESKPQRRAYNVAGKEVEILTYLNKIAEILSKQFDHTIVSEEVLLRQGTTFPAFFDQSLLVDTTAAQADFNFTPSNIDKWLPKVVIWCKEYGKKLLDNEAAISLEKDLLEKLSSETSENQFKCKM